MSDTPWGPSGQVVFDRTYSRPKDDGSKETWPETVKRVVTGNLALVYGTDKFGWALETWEEYDQLIDYMNDFAILPAGRHLWASGVTSALFNCWVAPWGKNLSRHFEFSFLRLMEGGGVGSNYSSRHTAKFGAPKREVKVKFVCRPDHPDMAEMAHLIDHEGSIGRIVEDSREGWAESLSILINFVMAKSGPQNNNILTFNLSQIRPSGSELKTSGGTASGPAPFAKMMDYVCDILNEAYFTDELTPLDLMEIDHAIAECVVAGGNRRSARMSILHWSDPQIFEFIRAKKDTGKHWTTNISVEIDDEFLKNLSNPHSEASQVHEAVCEAMLENGEPGYWNSSLSSDGEVGEILATNPCGEITLEAGEPCNLGHVNLDYFADKSWLKLIEAHKLITRFLIRATFGSVADDESREILDRNRRIGVGHLGVQGYWAKKGVRYSDIPRHAPASLKSLYQAVRNEAHEYSFALRIPEPVKVTDVAPTGSVAKLPGATEGIGALYAKWFEQRIRFTVRDEDQFATVMQAEADGFKVEDDVYDSSGMTRVVVYPTENILVKQCRDLGIPEHIVQSADQLTVREMLNVQRTYQKFWADNAVSYTVNVSPGALKPDDLALLLHEFLPDLKGTTIMVDESREQAPYTRITKEQYEAAQAKRVTDSTDLECSTGACPVR